MSFSDALDAPVEFNGQKFPVLSILDYIPWAEELREQEQQRKGSIIPADLSPLDRFTVCAQLASDIDIDQIMPLVPTPAGTLRVLRMSLESAGVKGEAADKIIRAIPAGRCVEMAMRLSGLFKAREKAAPADPPPAQLVPGQPPPVTLADRAAAAVPGTEGAAEGHMRPLPPAPLTLAAG